MIYHVKKPQYTHPPLSTGYLPFFLWDLLKNGANKLLGKIIGRLILQSQNDYQRTFRPDRFSSCYFPEMSHMEHTIHTHDGAELNTFELNHKSLQSLEPQYQPYIIHYNGNAACYEKCMNELVTDCFELKSNVIGFNYRNVGQSTGLVTSQDDLVTDGIAQVQCLLDRGVSPENITLKGQSLGGAIATLVAAHFHQQDVRINVFNARSFSSITNVIVAHIRNGFSFSGHQEKWWGKILGWVLSPFIKIILVLTNWEINTTQAYQSIPKTYKEYTLVRTNKQNRTADVIDDEVIPHYASIHAALKLKRKIRKHELDQLISIAEQSNSDANALQHLQEERAVFKDRKMQTKRAYQGGHNTDLTSIKNHLGNSAQAFFGTFVRKANIDHAVNMPSTNKFTFCE